MLARLLNAASRLVIEDSGQDIVEYALLSGFVAAAGLSVFPEIAERMSDGYADWVCESAAIAEPCPPAAAGPCPEPVPCP